VAYCVAGRGGTAAAAKAEGEEGDSSGSPSSRSVESGAGSMDAVVGIGGGAGGAARENGEGQKGLERRHGELEKTNGNGERETKDTGTKLLACSTFSLSRSVLLDHCRAIRQYLPGVSRSIILSFLCIIVYRVFRINI
jgi:hypothetical protein